MHNGQYKVSGKFMFWISRIAHNVIIDHYRDLKSCHIVETPRDKDLQNMKVASVLEMDHERNMSNQQVLSDVRRLVNALPDNQREVVYMRYFEDMPFKDIAKVTGVSINTALGRMRYAINNLRRLSRQHHVNLTLE
jgi:RNA polymerase sigma-70 factor (ECF subfamily)